MAVAGSTPPRLPGQPDGGRQGPGPGLSVAGRWDPCGLPCDPGRALRGSSGAIEEIAVVEGRHLRDPSGGQQPVGDGVDDEGEVVGLHTWGARRGASADEDCPASAPGAAAPGGGPREPARRGTPTSVSLRSKSMWTPDRRPAGQASGSGCPQPTSTIPGRVRGPVERWRLWCSGGLVHAPSSVHPRGARALGQQDRPLR